MRVIAGKYRRRTLTAPPGLDTRPTTDRVREALFQILGDLSDENVVDFFAGTGALGIEALSRGARHAVFVETNRPALAALRKNLERLQIDNAATIVAREVAKSRSALEALGPFDLVLADPPWKDAQPAALQVARATRGLLAPGGRLVLGHPRIAPIELPEEAGLVAVDRRGWGRAGLSFFEIAE